MSMNDVVEEALRRQARRDANLPLRETEAEIAERIQEDDERLERDIQADVVKLFRAYGCTVYSTSQKRSTRVTPGFPDLWVVHPRLHQAWFFETKTPTGKQSSAQEGFELDCIAANVAYVCGGVKAGEEHLIKIGAAERILNGELESKR